MNLSDSWLCLWPGLPRLWLRGDWQALGAAVLFAGALNLTLIHSFLWPELLPLPSPLWLWPILVLVWSIATWRGWQSVPDLLQVPVGAQPEAGAPDFLAEAQAAYLRGHWEETEILLQRQLDRYPDDIPAGLMLATLYRHSGRTELARQAVKGLRKWDAAQWWEFELEQELQAIERQEQELAAEDSVELAADLQ